MDVSKFPEGMSLEDAKIYPYRLWFYDGEAGEGPMIQAQEQLPASGCRVISLNRTFKTSWKREYIQEHWEEDLINAELSVDEAAERAQKALEVLKPTGNPFLDLCLWKGCFPSTRRRFFSEELKHKPIDDRIIKPAPEEYDEVYSWKGVRAD